MRFSILPESSRGLPWTTARYVFDALVGRERLRESLHRLLRLGDGEESGRVLVEPVDDARARDASDPREVGAVVEKGVDERACEVPGRGVHDHSRRLVHDEHLIVLEDDVYRNVLRLRHRGDGRRDLNLDLVVLRDLHPRLRRNRAVDGDVSGLHEPLYPRPREVGVGFEKPLV